MASIALLVMAQFPDFSPGGRLLYHAVYVTDRVVSIRQDRSGMSP